MTNFEKAISIITNAGNTLTQRDLMAIDRELNKIGLDDLIEAQAIVNEAISLIVTSPDYTGDIKPD